MGGPDPDGPNRQKFHKRSTTIVGKLHELADLCNAQVYAFIAHPRGNIVYNSVEDGSFPPPDTALEKHYSSVNRLGPRNVSQFLFNEPHPKKELRELEEYFRFRDELRQTIKIPPPPNLLAQGEDDSKEG